MTRFGAWNRPTEQTYDVIVVGGGGSGLACAVKAAEYGARVLVLEKCPALGGTTGIAIGSFTANGTDLQRKRRITDNPDDHEVDAGKFGPADHQRRNNQALRRYFLGETAATLEWLCQLGLVFHGPNPEPPNRVPRMHNVVPNAKAYIAAFHLQLIRHGGTVLCNAYVEELQRDGPRVTGVMARVDGKRLGFVARQGVVLAAGDYANSPTTITRFKGPRFAAIEGINPQATGDGHRLAESAGAHLVNMDLTYGPELRFVPRGSRGFEQLLPSRGIGLTLLGLLLPFVPPFVVRRLVKRLLVTWQHPEDSLFADGAILLNREGNRFCNERSSPDREIAVAAQPGKIAWLLLDSRLADRYSSWPHFVSTAPEIAYAYVADYLRLRSDVAVAGDSVEDIAAKRGLPIEAARRAVREWNQTILSAQPDEFGRNGNGTPLSGSRWVLLGPVKSYFTTTEGGAAISHQMQVLSLDQQPIPGLYAVGQNGLGGMVLWGHGLHIAWAITSGRLVGDALGRQTLRKPAP